MKYHQMKTKGGRYSLSRHERVCIIIRVRTKIVSQRCDSSTYAAMPTDYDTADDDSQAVLDMHHRKNRPIKPPNPQHHVDLAAMSHRNKSASHISNKTRGSKNVPRHADTSLHVDDTLPRSGQLSRRSDVPSADVSGSRSSGVPTPGDGSESDVHVAVHASRRPRSHRKPTSSQIGFYQGHWVQILILAKAFFRYYIHTETAFPERNDESLDHARECVLEAIQNYMTENEHANVDKS